MVQNILSGLTSDQVNSISDTVESLQVATIIQNKYYDIAARGDLPEHNQLFQLVPSNDATKPVQMLIPTSPVGTNAIQWIKYFDSNTADSTQVSQFGSFSHGLNVNIVPTTGWTTTATDTVTIALGTVQFHVGLNLPVITGQGVLCQAGTNNMFGTVNSYVPGTGVLSLNIVSTSGSGTFSSWVIFNSNNAAVPGYKQISIISVKEFLDMVNLFNPSETNVKSMTFTEGGYNFNFYYKNDHQPQYCTVIQNTYVLFDTFDLTQDNTLQGSKTMCYGQIIPPFSLTDSYIPNIDDQQFPLLLNESKSLAYFELKNMIHAKAEQEAKRQWSAVQKDKAIVNRPTYFDQLADFGRIPRTGGYGGGPPIYRWMRGK